MPEEDIQVEFIDERKIDNNIKAISSSRSGSASPSSSKDFDFEDDNSSPFHERDVVICNEYKLLDLDEKGNAEGDRESECDPSYFSFLDDYVRFDVSRRGFPCFSGYSVSVQYEEDFMLGKGAHCYLGILWNGKCKVKLFWNGRAFQIDYYPRASCFRPKNCIYKMRICDTGEEIGAIHFKQDLVQIYNNCDQSVFIRRKTSANNYLIKSEFGERLGTVEIFRGLRGDILYYALSILGDLKGLDKALLIGLTLAMDIRQRESDMRCTLIWVPICCVLVIGLFTFLPWLYFYSEI